MYHPMKRITLNEYAEVVTEKDPPINGKVTFLMGAQTCREFLDATAVTIHQATKGQIVGYIRITGTVVGELARQVEAGTLTEIEGLPVEFGNYEKHGNAVLAPIRRA